MNPTPFTISVITMLPLTQWMPGQVVPTRRGVKFQYSGLCLLTEGYWVDHLQIWPSCIHICLQGDFAVPSIKCLLPNLLSLSWTWTCFSQEHTAEWHCASFKPMSPETLHSFSWNPAKPPRKQAQASLLDNDRLIAHIWGCWHFSQKSWFELVIYPVWHVTWYTLHMFKKQGDNRQTWHTPFPILNQTINSYFLTCI